MALCSAVSLKDDFIALQGIFLHGYGQWGSIFANPTLPFAAITASGVDLAVKQQDPQETTEGRLHFSEDQLEGGAEVSIDAAEELTNVLARGKMVPRRLKYLEKVLRKQLQKKDLLVRGWGNGTGLG